MLENGRNNGSLYLFVRDATDRIGMVDTAAIKTAFDELVNHGLIARTNEGYFEIKAAERSHARYWRLTWVPANN